MKILNCLASLSLLTLTACPAASIDSVDGLGGGTLTSALTAPAITSTELSTESLDATGDVTAATVTAGAVTSSGAVAGSSLVVQRGAARVGFFGLVVGNVSMPDGQTGSDPDGANPNYAVRQRACAEAFPSTDDGLPAAHVCTTQEAMAHALQAPDTVPATVSDGIVHTYMSAAFGLPLEDGLERIVSDCGAVDNRASTGSSLRLHRRDDGNWSLVIRDGCSVGETQLVCCQ
jgi:hypothetical protein